MATDKTASTAGVESGEVKQRPEVESASLAADLEFAKRMIARKMQALAARQKGGNGAILSPTAVADLSAEEERLRIVGLISKDESCFFGDEKEYKHYLAQGYEPVVEAGRQPRVKELLAFKRPMVLAKAEEMEAANRSQSALSGAFNEGVKSAKELPDVEKAQKAPVSP